MHRDVRLNTHTYLQTQASTHITLTNASRPQPTGLFELMKGTSSGFPLSALTGELREHCHFEKCPPHLLFKAPVSHPSTLWAHNPPGHICPSPPQPHTPKGRESDAKGTESAHKSRELQRGPSPTPMSH